VQDLYQHRVVEELYDVQTDPDCLNNLISDPAYQVHADALRKTLEAWMQRSGDHLLPVFRRRHDADFREAYVQQKEQEAAQRRKKPKRQRNKKSANRLTGDLR
jgi:hypothetical protein